MVARRCIAVLRRGTWEREIHGFAFSIDEKDCWYFVPDEGSDESGCATFFGNKVPLLGPDRTARDFRPKTATLLHRAEVEEGLGVLKDGLEGL